MTDATLPGWRGVRWALGGLALLLAACAIHALAGFDAGPLSWLLEKWGYNVVLVGSGLICLARAARVRAERAAWLTMGVGVIGWAVGNVWYTAVLWNLDPIPIPSLSDVLWIVYYPIVYVAVAMLLRARIARFHASLWVDGVLAALAVAALSAAIVFESVLNATGGGRALEVATNLAYPLGDLVLLGMVTGGVALTGWKPGRTWGALALSFIVFGVSDGIYLWANATGTWVAGSVFEGGWPAATLLLAWAAWMPPERVRPRPLDGRRMLVVPTLFALLGLTLLISDHFSRMNLLAVALAWASVLAVIGRFGMTFFANLTLLDDTREEALTDALTGLGNRRRLVRDLEEVMYPGGTPSVLVLFDLNGFKGYNDVFGHPAGDALLGRLGTRLGAAVDPHARAYRIGGDEFCILASLQATNPLAIVARGRSALDEAGDGFEITAAYGCVLVPEEADDVGAALGIADRRMYAEKATARRSADEQSRDVLLKALEEHHPDLGAHVHDVGLLAAAVATELGLDARSLQFVRHAAELHDIGKVAVPTAILDKPGKLEPDEWQFIARHTLIGERILGAAPALRPVATLVRASHERFDGNGYPDGLRGEEIPLGARIVSVCDAYDAMTSDRPYQRTLSPQEAIAELNRCAGTQFDPQVVDAFCRVNARVTADAAE